MDDNTPLRHADKYGFLLRPSIKLHRSWFLEMVKLLGINVIYRYPMYDKTEGVRWTTYAEIDAQYSTPQIIGCIFDEHPTQQTLKKIGWMSELQESSSIIHVQYDLDNIQQGCLFEIPSGLDYGENRFFRVVRLSTGIVYPASITCEIVPEYYDTYKPDINTHQFNSNTNVLNDEEYFHTWN